MPGPGTPGAPRKRPRWGVYGKRVRRRLFGGSGSYLRRYKRRPSYKKRKGRAITNKLTALGVMEKEIDHLKPFEDNIPVAPFPVTSSSPDGQAFTPAEQQAVDNARLYGQCYQLGDLVTTCATGPNPGANPPYHHILGQTNQYGLGLWVLHKKQGATASQFVDNFKGKEIYAKCVNMELRIKIDSHLHSFPGPNSDPNEKLPLTPQSIASINKAWRAAGMIMQFRYIRVKEKLFANQRDRPLIDNDLFLDWDGKPFGVRNDFRMVTTDRAFHAPIQKKHYSVIEHKYFELQAPGQSEIAAQLTAGGVTSGTYDDKEFANPSTSNTTSQPINTVSTMDVPVFLKHNAPTRPHEKRFRYKWKFNKSMDMEKLPAGWEDMIPPNRKGETGIVWDYYVPARNELIKSKIIILVRPKGIPQENLALFWHQDNVAKPHINMQFEGNQTYVDS